MYQNNYCCIKLQIKFSPRKDELRRVFRISTKVHILSAQNDLP